MPKPIIVVNYMKLKENISNDPYIGCQSEEEQKRTPGNNPSPAPLKGTGGRGVDYRN